MVLNRYHLSGYLKPQGERSGESAYVQGFVSGPCWELQERREGGERLLGGSNTTNDEDTTQCSPLFVGVLLS